MRSFEHGSVMGKSHECLPSRQGGSSLALQAESLEGVYFFAVAVEGSGGTILVGPALGSLQAAAETPDATRQFAWHAQTVVLNQPAEFMFLEA